MKFDEIFPLFPGVIARSKNMKDGQYVGIISDPTGKYSAYYEKNGATVAVFKVFTEEEMNDEWEII